MNIRFSLRYRIAVTIFIVQVLIILLILWRILSLSYQEGYQQMIANQNIVLDLLSYSIRNTLFDGEYHELQKFIQPIAADPNVLNVLIADWKNQIVASSDFSQIGSKLPLLSDNNSQFWRVRKITYHSQKIGILAVQFSNVILVRSMEKIRHDSIILAITGIGFVAIFGLVIGFLLTRRLEKLTHVAKHFSQGNLSIRVGFSGKDEVAHLSRTFDDMADRLEIYIARLQQAHHELENRVSNRTAALQASNQQLKDNIDAREKVENELRQAKELAEAASKAKSEFLAKMSHEIRTPMNGMFGMTDLLLTTQLTEQQQVYVKILQNSSKILLSITNDILDFSKLEAGKLRLDIETFQLQEMIDEVLNMFATLAERKGLELMQDIAVDVPLNLKGDAGKIRQILVNLVSNAIKFTTDGQVIVSIDCQHKSDKQVELHFEVQDTGIGITLEDQAHLFEMFRQVDDSFTRKYGGTGLGLSITRQLVEKMEGEIGIKSVVGEGSIFWFTLNLEYIAEQKNNTLDLRHFQKLHVLVVDDNKSQGFILEKLLYQWGSTCQLAESAEQALEIIKQYQFGLAIIDYNMPDYNGLELINTIRQNKLLSCPLILLTSVDYMIDYQRSEQFGIHGYLTKPISPIKLYQIITDTLSQRPNKPQIPSEPTIEDLNVADQMPTESKILVAEDNAMNQIVIRGMLKALKCEMDIVDNGKTALEAVKQNQYDLVIMDCEMPEMDGYQATIEIRKYEQQKALSRLPIIAMTAHALPEYQAKSFEVGMDAHISKPISLSKLRETLLHWLNPKINHKPVIDKTILLQLKQSLGQSIVDKMVQEFLRYLPQQLQVLKQVIAERDYLKIKRASHQLKGGCKQIGAQLLAEQCQQLENLAIHQKSEQFDMIRKEMEETIKQVLLVLNEYQNDTIK